jgi:GTP cyclohydrolase I
MNIKNDLNDSTNDSDSVMSLKYEEKLKRLSTLMTEAVSLINPNAHLNKTIDKTPERFSKALLEFVEGTELNLDKLLNDAIFESEGFDDLVLIKNIEFTSLCEHHLLPFFGKATIGYIPKDKILGLSKFPRLIQGLAKKMHIQERLTKEIAEVVDQYLEPHGVVVVTASSHSCMCFRGVRSFNSQTDVIYTTGCFKEKGSEQLTKFFNLVNCDKK